MTVVLLHDLGDPVGGAGWRSAAPPNWIIPDLPGHGSTPAVRTGHYDPMSAVRDRALDAGAPTRRH